jgi:hypothetical protein
MGVSTILNWPLCVIFSLIEGTAKESLALTFDDHILQKDTLLFKGHNPSVLACIALEFNDCIRLHIKIGDGQHQG